MMAEVNLPKRHLTNVINLYETRLLVSTAAVDSNALT